MYIPKDYLEKDQKAIDSFIESVEFMTIMVNGDDGFPLGVHFPLISKKKDDQWIFEGHIPLANPISKSLLNDGKVLVILSGAHGYISSSVYDHENVSTWNYQILHAYGVSFEMSNDEMENHLDELMSKFESGREKPVEYKKFSQKLLDDHLYQIRGFRVLVNKIEMASKLSQNRDSKNFDAIVEDVDKYQNNPSLAEAMKKSRS